MCVLTFSSSITFYKACFISEIQNTNSGEEMDNNSSFIGVCVMTLT